MPLENLPNNDESTLHTFPDGTSEFQVFPAPATVGFTPIERWDITTNEVLRDADLFSLEAIGDEGNRPRRDDTTDIPIVMTGSSCVLQINGRYRGEWSSTATYNVNDIVLYTDGNYYRADAVLGGTSVPGISTDWTVQTISRPPMWRAVQEDGTSPRISGSGGLAPQIFISDGATLDTFNVRMEVVGALIGDDIEERGGSTPDPYTIMMHETELYQGATNRPAFFRVRPNALTSDSEIQSLILNGLEQGIYLYDPTSNSWGTALDNLELTVIRGGIIMDAGGGASRIAELRDFDETANLARGDVNTDAVYSIGVATDSASAIGSFSTAVLINNARGMECGAYPRIGVPTGQRRGSAITVKETSFFVQDSAGNGLDGVTVYIPSSHETSITSPNNDVITFNEDQSQTLLLGTDYIPDPANSDVILTSGTDGNTPQESVHLGYWQFSDNVDDYTLGTSSNRINARISAGNTMFEQVGNSATVIYSVFGREITTQTVDFTGTGVLNVTSTPLPVAEGITGTAAPSGISISVLGTVMTVTLTADSTLDDLFDAIHAEEVRLAGLGTIVNYADGSNSSISFTDLVDSLTITGDFDLTEGTTFTSMTGLTGNLTLPAGRTLFFGFTKPSTEFVNLIWGTGNTVAANFPTVLINTDEAVTVDLDFGVPADPALSFEILGDVDLTGGILSSTNGVITIQTRDGTNLGATVTGSFTFVAPPVTYTITIPTTRAGYYSVWDIVGGTATEHTATTAFAADDSVSFTVSSDDYADDDTFEIRHKYTSSDTGVGTSNIVYQETMTTHRFDAGDFTVAEPVEVTSVLVGSAQTLLAAETFTVTSITEDTVARYEVEITNGDDNTPLIIASDRALGLAIEVANTEAYFNTYHLRRASDPMIEFQTSNGVQWDGDYVTLSSGNLDGTFRIQHVARQYSADPDASAGRNTDTSIVRARTGAAEISFQNDGTATLADINNGVTDVFHREFATDVVDYERTLIDIANAAFAGAYQVGDTDNDPTLTDVTDLNN